MDLEHLLDALGATMFSSGISRSCLCSLFRRGEARIVATTTMPCTSCMQTLCSYGIEEIYYHEIYRESDAPEIADLYGIKLEQVECFPLSEFSPALARPKAASGEGPAI